MKEPRAELVRIDAHGIAHPIGPVAGQRMRARQGAYRLLPSPEHVAFMRFTGEDGRRDEEDGALVRLAGEITAPGAMCDILALVGQTGWRGQLVVFDGSVRRTVFFDQGSVVGVQTNEERERLGAVLYQYGVLGQDDIERIMALTAQGKRFGEAAVELGFLPQSDVYKYIKKQIEEVVFATLSVGDGTFFFLDGFDPARLVSGHAVSANSLLLDSVRRMDELPYFRQKIPTSAHVPVRVEGRTPGQEFATVMACVDGRRSVEAIGRISGLGEFETTRQLYSLVQSGDVHIHPPRIEGGPEAIVETANTVLREAFAAATRVNQQDALRQALASFAVGAGVYDLLFRNAGPDETGSLKRDVVAENSIVIAGGGDAEQLLSQLLHDYASFALFSAGALLERPAEAELNQRVAPAMTALRPGG